MRREIWARDIGHGSLQHAMLTVAVGQFSAGTDKEENLAVIREVAQLAQSRGASLLALPEYSAFATASLDARIVDSAEGIDGWFGENIQTLARELELAVVVGMNERIVGADRVHNTVLMVDQRGELAGTYRKTHLYDAFGHRESTWIEAAALSQPETMTIDDLTIGVQTCFDLRFPEVTRRVVDAGADVVVVPAQWMPGPAKVRHWTTLLTARAIENTSYVCGAGQAMPSGCGHSMVIDPMGRILAELDSDHGVACVEADPMVVESVRSTNPSLTARRFDVVPRSAATPPGAPDR